MILRDSQIEVGSIKLTRSLESFSFQTKAYAKINLGLRVLGKRKDGYHDIVTIFQRISLHDEVAVTISEKTNQSNNFASTEKVEYSGPKVTENPEDNLCIKAVDLFQSEFGILGKVSVDLKKNIPAGAGLGGGSSDAASVIHCMANIYRKNGIEINSNVLLRLAGKIGSDVSFFLFIDDRFNRLNQYTAALGQEKGEVLSPSYGLESEDRVLIVWPRFQISTQEAYQNLDDVLTFNLKNRTLNTRTFLNFRGNLRITGISNDFEGPVFAAYPELTSAKAQLLGSGAKYASLSGSGSAIYGIFGVEAMSKAVQIKWPESWLSFACRPC